ncbi:plexin domain-containing protein 1-like isoform X2 [Limulus polyphemus]|uniref:Plexin domain-containing protein 1-like isoform X2 n=1 Tax=Limulus polyphemus TaxID=6850 RepID=A0ABM1B853_LIMPO|nr:plexin domain-containing protein 1-like isoform X2 [Limulus polyphemus]
MAVRDGWRVKHVFLQIVVLESLFIFVAKTEPEKNLYQILERQDIENSLDDAEQLEYEFRSSYDGSETPLFLVKRQADLKKTVIEKKPIPKPKVDIKVKDEGITEITTNPDQTSYKIKASTVSTTLAPDSTNATEDHHTYYNSSIYTDPKEARAFWIDLENNHTEVITHQMLSDSHRRAATVSLSFDFPFYGHLVRNITIATGGFLYVGEYMHSWLAATQYIAPLMANFDTSLSNISTIRLADNGSMFVVQWEEVALQEGSSIDTFTFQVSLFDNGNIVFVYKKVPISVTEIKDEDHPVKIGLSDAYIYDRKIFFIRRKTIYEYHRIDMKREEIGNWTALYFTALPTCLSFKDCDSCVSANINFNCSWCEAIKRCSDGIDRHRQEWMAQGCGTQANKECSEAATTVPPKPSPSTLVTTTEEFTPENATGKVTTFSSSTFTTIPTTTTAATINPEAKSSAHSVMTTTVIKATTTTEEPSPSILTLPLTTITTEKSQPTQSALAEEKSSSSSSFGAGGVVAILLILAIVLGVGIWIGYAYKNPQTASGQLLIKYRPSQWRWGGQARYTAASIHM